ncbi:hypothetical protein Tco_1090211 [Tanacetum coccineum]|uniref:Uncharacterized protein n=1 Tax=Tanacetum coccineum TaxID=301880 RepID=A0ABQ5I3Q1_9ASTR
MTKAGYITRSSTCKVTTVEKGAAGGGHHCSKCKVKFVTFMLLRDDCIITTVGDKYDVKEKCNCGTVTHLQVMSKRWSVLSSCTGRFHCGDETAKNWATVLTGSTTLHWPVPLRQRNRVCVFTSEWAISSLPNGIDSNPNIYPPPHEDPLLISDALFYPRPPGKTRKVKGVDVTFDPFQMVIFELKTNLKKWEIILSENASTDMTLPYGMLLTRLFKHVRVVHPHALSNDLYLLDYVMILSLKRESLGSHQVEKGLAFQLSLLLNHPSQPLPLLVKKKKMIP